MPLSLEELLADPTLGLELVAGARGLRSRGPVRWAHISEIPDPTPWLEGGEILLTTGLGVRGSDEQQRRLIAGLDARGCPGVGFGLGVCLDAVPRAMLDEADKRSLPLFTVPYEVPFIAVTKRVSHHIFDEHYQTLREAINLHRQVLGTVLAGGGLGGLLETFGRSMPDYSLLLFDYYGQVLAARQAPGGPLLPPAGVLWPLANGEIARRDRGQLEWDGHVLLVGALRLEGQVEAVLVLLGDRPLLEHEALLLEQGLTGVSLELARGLSIREARRGRVDELLEEVQAGRLGGLPLAAHLQRLGIDPAAPYRVLCLHRPPGISQRALCALLEDVLSAAVTPIVGRNGDAAYCLVQGDDGRAEQIATAVDARGWTGVRIGRSRAKHDPEALRTAIREAAVAAAAADGGTIRDVEELGMTGVLAGIDDDAGTGAFCQHVLGPVLEHDAREGSALIDSLRAYLLHGCRPGPAAAELRVHRHTLTYRLDRIRELTGRDPRDGQHLLEFGLALELHARQSAAG